MGELADRPEDTFSHEYVFYLIVRDEADRFGRLGNGESIVYSNA